MRFAVLALALAGLAVAADGPDLSEYKTVATAKQVTPRELTGPPKQPAHLGVHAEPDAAGGLRLAAVAPDSPAAKAGLKAGDLLLAVGGASVRDLSALREKLLSLFEGDAVAIKYQRGDKAAEVTVTLGAPSRPLTGRRAVLGVMTQPLDDGVKISNVTPGMPAAKVGLQVGDVVVKVGASDITTVEKMQETLGGYLPGQRVTVAVKRDGKALAFDCELAPDPSASRPEDRPTLARWDEGRLRLFKGDVYRLAVVPVAFADVAFIAQIPPKEWEKALFSKGEYNGRSATGQPVYGSLNDYYLELSCGKLSVTGKVFKPVTLAKKQADYTAGAAPASLFSESLDKLVAESGKDALNGYDGLFFLHAGKRVPTQRGGVFWPHRSTLRYQGKAWAYFIAPEMTGSFRGGGGAERMSSISVASHEFGHMLGLPDLYARPENPGSEGVGVWCTMSTGHGSDGKPLHLGAWCKEQLGWLKPCVIDPTHKQKLILAPVEGSATECYKVPLRADGSEYLLLENRKRQMSDRDLPGEGMLIWRVVDGRPILEESHGLPGPDGPTRFLGSVPYPTRSNAAFTPYTQPSSKPDKAGGLPVHITNIQKLPDGRVTFHIGYEYL